jgi:hypothetical protein
MMSLLIYKPKSMDKATSKRIIDMLRSEDSGMVRLGGMALASQTRVEASLFMNTYGQGHCWSTQALCRKAIRNNSLPTSFEVIRILSKRVEDFYVLIGFEIGIFPMSVFPTINVARDESNIIRIEE